VTRHLGGLLVGLEIAAVDRQEGDALVLGQPRVRANGPVSGFGVLAGLILSQHPCVLKQRLGRDVERVSDRTQDVQRGLVQATLDLAEIRVGDLGQRRELAKREVRQLALSADEAPKRVLGSFTLRIVSMVVVTRGRAGQGAA